MFRPSRWVLQAGLLKLFILLTIGTPLFADVEPNDAPATAEPLQLPFHTVLGTISNSNDIDYYQFSAEAGRQITVWVQGPSNGSDLVPVLALYDASGGLLAYNDGEVNLANTTVPADDPILYLKLPTSGTYFLSVSNADAFDIEGAESTTGAYTLNLFSKFDGAAFTDGSEPNDSMPEATVIPIPFETRGSNLVYFGDVDWYRLTAKKGDVVSIDIDALQLTATPSQPFAVNARVGLFDDLGQTISIVDVGPDPDDGFSQDPAIVFEVPKDGNYNIAIASPPDTGFSSAYNNASFLLNPLVRSSDHVIGYYRLQVRTLNQLYFPQIANGSFGSVRFRTSVVLINTSASWATGSMTLFTQAGSLMKDPFGLGNGEGNPSYFSIAPGGSLLVETDGAGPGESGYAVIQTPSEIGGSAVFSQYDNNDRLLTEAGVGASSPMDFFVIPVDVTGDFNTGVAIANTLHIFDVNLYLKLVSTSGETVATRSMLLGEGEQISRFISGPGQLFPNTTNFRGSLQVLADATVASVSLRSSSRTLTTLEAAPLNQSPKSTRLIFPHVVVGAAESVYRSSIILTNPNYFPATGTLRFFRSDGSPLNVEIGSYQASTHDINISPQGTLFLESNPVGALESGYAVVDVDQGLGGVIIFSQFNAATGQLETEAAVPPSPQYTDFRIFVQSEGGFTTGFALANPNETSASLDFRLQLSSDPSQIMEQSPDPLEAGVHRAELISGVEQAFPDFTGTGTLEVISGRAIPAVTLRITAKTMTALPVVPVVK